MSNIPTASRPKMQNYGVDTSPAGLLDWTWTDERLANSRNYWIASTRADGAPHVAPIWGVWLDGALYFGSDSKSRKARNFLRDPRAALHLESGDEVVILEGQMRVETNAAVLARVGQEYATKYGLNPVADEMPGSLFFAFVPRIGLSWRETDFPKSATRWTFAPTGSEDSSS
jgi:hypothetical protein